MALAAAASLILLGAGFAVFAHGGSTRPPVAPAAASPHVEQVGDAALAFTPNAGRFPGSADFVAHGRGYSVALKRDGASLALSGGAVVQAHLVGANARQPRATRRLPGVVN